MAAPDLHEAVIGYRTWRVTARGALGSLIAAGCSWEIRAHTTAICNAYVVPHHPHESAPVSWCTCGLYAHHAPQPALVQAGPGERCNCGPCRENRARLVAGAVVAWGAVEVHAEGFRAEHAEPVALLWRDPAHALIEATARNCSLPVVEDVDQLVALALEHGAPVPARLRP